MVCFNIFPWNSFVDTRQHVRELEENFISDELSKAVNATIRDELAEAAQWLRLYRRKQAEVKWADFRRRVDAMVDGIQGSRNMLIMRNDVSSVFSRIAHLKARWHNIKNSTTVKKAKMNM